MNLFAGVSLLLWFAVLSSGAEFFHQASRKEAYTVHLEVMIDGRDVALPKEVHLKNKRRSITLAVKDENVVVPARMADEPTLTLKARFGDSLVTIPGIPRSALEAGWIIMLADHDFGNYAFAFPKGTDLQSKCILLFDSAEGDGSGMKVSNCRTPAPPEHAPESHSEN